MSPIHDDPPHEQMLSEALAIADRVAPLDGSHPKYNTVQEHLADLSRMVAVWMRVSAASVRAHYNRPPIDEGRAVSLFGVRLPVVEVVKLAIAALILLSAIVIIALLLGSNVSLGPGGLQMNRIAGR